MIKKRRDIALSELYVTYMVVSQHLTSLRWGTMTDQDEREGGREAGLKTIIMSVSFLLKVT